MINRYAIGDLWSLQKGLTYINVRVLMDGSTPVLQQWQPASINSGTSGSYTTASSTGGGTSWPAQYAQGAEGVRSVTRTGTGLWTVVMQDNYTRLLQLAVTQSFAGGLNTIVAIGENTTITSLTTAGGSTIGVALLSSTGTAADPATTTNVNISLILQASTAP